MKTMTLLLAVTMIFGASAVFACERLPDDQDKGDETLTVEANALCGGSCQKPKPAPAPEPELDPTCGNACGGDKDAKPAPKPECGEGCTCEKCSKDKE